MRAFTVFAAMLGATLFLCSCGTPYRYEYYDYKGKAVDEKNDERGKRIDNLFRGRVPESGAGDIKRYR